MRARTHTHTHEPDYRSLEISVLCTNWRPWKFGSTV